MPPCTKVSVPLHHTKLLTQLERKVITIYRVLRAYGFMVGPKRSPIHYYMQADRWDNYSHSCMTAIMAWMGDFLVVRVQSQLGWETLEDGVDELA